MAWRIAWEDDGVCKRFSGHVTAVDFLRAMVILQADVRFMRARWVMHDFSDVCSHDAASVDVSGFASLARSMIAPHARMKIAVVSSDPGLVGMVERFASPLQSQLPLRAFADITQARAWVS